MNHPLLRRQLHQLGLNGDAPPDAAAWQALLERLNNSYEQADRDRYLLERALDLAAEELHSRHQDLSSTTEVRIELERDKLSAVINSLGDGLCILDDTGYLVSINPAGQAMLGWHGDSLYGQPLLDVLEVVSEEEQLRAITSTGLHRMVGSGRALRVDDGYFRRQDGSTFPVSYVLNPIVKDRRLMGAVLIFRDITVQKQAEQELQRQLDETKLLNRVVAAVTSALDPETVLYHICRELAEALHLPQTAVALLEEDNRYLAVVSEYYEAGRAAAVGTRINVEQMPATQWVLEHRAPLLISDAVNDPRLGGLFQPGGVGEDRGTRSLLLVPLFVRDQLIGTLGLDALEARDFTPPEIELVQNVAAVAGQALEKANLYEAVEQELLERIKAEEALRQQNEYLAGLHDTTLGLINRLDVDSLLQDIVERAGALVGSPHGYLYNYVAGKRDMVMQVGTGVFSGLVGHPMERGVGLAGGVWARGEPLVVDDYQTWAEHLPSPAPEYDALRAVVGLPLRLEGETIGVIGLAYLEEGRVFDEDKIELLSRFSQLAALALHNARLYNTLQSELAERREAQRALVQAKEAAEAASHAKSAFLANMSHELRTPLNSIIGYAELLAEGIYGELDARQLDRLDKVTDNGRRLLGLISDILDISKIEAGQMNLTLDAVDITPIVRRCAEDLEPLASKKGLSLECTCGPGLHPVLVDRGRLTQVINNLISNAIKFTPEGHIKVSTRSVTADEVSTLPVQPPMNAQRGNLIAVQDTGIGIDAADQGYIFDEFRQVDASSTRKYEGTGLGLAISRRLVQMMGGRIWVQSTPGEGSTFYVLLPVNQ